MKQKKITLFFRNLEYVHLGKDVFLTPYYLGKVLGFEVEIVHFGAIEKDQIPEYVNGVHIKEIGGGRWKNLSSFWHKILLILYVIKHARDIDVLMQFHFIPSTQIILSLYKLFNSHGQAYVKLDQTIDQLRHSNPKNINISFFKLKFRELLLDNISAKAVDIISTETSSVYNFLSGSKDKRFQLNKLILVENGFDEDLLKTLSIQENKYEEKENVIITVGRLGTPQKNTEMILNALSNVDLNNWKMYLIGPIEETLKRDIDLFYGENTDIINKVIFTGSISDKQELWQYYNKAKVFILTSRWESSGIVLYEAQRFRNYIITTEVGAFRDVIGNNQYGLTVSQNSNEELSQKIASIVNGKLNIDVYRDFNTSLLSWEHRARIIANRINV